MLKNFFKIAKFNAEKDTFLVELREEHNHQFEYFFNGKAYFVKHNSPLSSKRPKSLLSEKYFVKACVVCNFRLDNGHHWCREMISLAINAKRSKSFRIVPLYSRQF